MTEQWICMSCLCIGQLNQHGRCPRCDSDAVAIADTGKAWERREVNELEELWERN